MGSDCTIPGDWLNFTGFYQFGDLLSFLALFIFQRCSHALGHPLFLIFLSDGQMLVKSPCQIIPFRLSLLG